MWSFEIKPTCHLHISKSRNIVKYYVVDICLSSCVVERHIFSNARKFDSFVNHLSKVMPWYSKYYSRLSFDNYSIFSEELTDEFTFSD